MLTTSVARATVSVGDAITQAADGLTTTPPQTGLGDWSGESPFTGPIVAGLIRAYQVTGNDAYKNSAIMGGSYMTRPAMIIGSYNGQTLYNFGGEDVFGISRL